MFSPLDVGTFDNLLAMEIAEQDRKKIIDDLICNLLQSTTLTERQYYLSRCKIPEQEMTDEEVDYINACLRANRKI